MSAITTNTPPLAMEGGLRVFKSGGQTFRLDPKYAMIRNIGSGAYGVVISALDESTGKKVAIKKVPKAFADEIDAKRILREIKLLKSFNHDNVVAIVDMMEPNVNTIKDFQDIYIVLDLMETDLHRIIYSKQALTVDHVQYFLYQILRGLKYIHSANVLHRDLKPSNLLVNSNCDLKICDLGLARGILPEDDVDGNGGGGSMILTEYVVTRWYRAPEIMLACQDYTKAIDMWSVGCIFAELLQRKPYVPGDDYIDQLTRICAKVGRPDETDLNFIASDKAKRFMMRIPQKNVQALQDQFPGVRADAIDLLGKMLQFVPGKRITVDEAINHPFLADIHNPEDAPVSESQVSERSERALRKTSIHAMDLAKWLQTVYPYVTNQLNSYSFGSLGSLLLH